MKALVIICAILGLLVLGFIALGILLCIVEWVVGCYRHLTTCRKCKGRRKRRGREWQTVSLACESQSIKDRIIGLLEAQCAKGEAKYGHALDQCPDDKFDWKLMAMEELIDLAQYQQKEIIRLERLLNP